MAIADRARGPGAMPRKAMTDLEIEEALAQRPVRAPPAEHLAPRVEL